MAHREGIREYLKDVEVHGLVYDWGCGTKPISKYLKPSKASFVEIDKIDFGTNVVYDIEKPVIIPSLQKPSFVSGGHFAFCLEVLEHCWDSKQVIKNIYNNLRSGGVLYLSQPFMYEVHKDDDRVRYTHHGLKQLLEEVGFTVEDIHPTVGDLDHAEGYILRARK